MSDKQGKITRSVGVKTQSFQAGLSEEEKERIIKEFLPFIKYTAHRLSWRLPPQLTVDDLVSSGLMGLLDALEKFEPGRVKLKTYAEIRIKGAIFDELRAVDWVPRSTKKKAGRLKSAHLELEKKLGRPPEDEEVVKSLGISLDEYYKMLYETCSVIAVRLEDFRDGGSSGDGLNVMECIPDRNSKDPLSLLEDSDVKEALAGLIEELPAKEKLILSLYYWEELTMREIGKTLDLTESRVCQLHGQALLRLKAKMGKPSRHERHCV
jgi:RNA polymerase sigma factor for flagellar operon FliA